MFRHLRPWLLPRRKVLPLAAEMSGQAHIV